MSESVTGYEKFEHVLSLLDNMPEGHTDGTIASKYFDMVFGYIHANFDVPETSTIDDVNHPEVVACRDILINRRAAYQNMRKIPPVILETVFPVAVAAFMIADHNGALGLPIQPVMTKQFREFYDRYGFMIIEGRGRN